MNSKVITESGSNYVKFGNGLLIQWGIVTSGTITFSKPFRDTSYGVGMAMSNLLGKVTYNYNTNRMWGISSSKTSTNFKVSDPYEQSWLAIGYWNVPK